MEIRLAWTVGEPRKNKKEKATPCGVAYPYQEIYQVLM